MPDLINPEFIPKFQSFWIGLSNILKMQLVRLRQKGVQYFVDCGKDDDILIMAHTTSEFEGDDQKLGLDKDLSVFEAKFKDLPLLDSFPNKINSSDKASEGFFIEDIDIFSEYLCLYERSLFDARQRNDNTPGPLLTLTPVQIIMGHPLDR